MGLGAKVPFAVFCNRPQYEVPDAMNGSIMDLEPGTTYEVRLTLSDPDGVEGEAEKVVKAATRPETRQTDMKDKNFPKTNFDQVNLIRQKP